MRRGFVVLLVGVLAMSAAMPHGVLAQDPVAPADSVQVVEIVLVDGSRLVGLVLSETDTGVTFRTVSGVVISLERAQIRSQRILPGTSADGRFMPADPNRSRLLFSATGRSVGAGRGYFADYYVFFPFVAYGFSDVVTVGAGISLIPGLREQLVYIAPKITIVERENTAVSVGMLAGTVTGEDTWGGLLYGVSTFGNDQRSASLGVGFGFGDGDVSSTPVFLVGGEVRLSASLKLITENYIIPVLDGVFIASGGIRFFGDRLAADLGFISFENLIDEGGFPFVPWVGFAYNFGN